MVGRVKHHSLDDDPRIALYLPHGQAPARAMSVVVRSSTDPASLVASIRDAIRAVDGTLPIYSVRTMDQYLDLSLARQRFTALLLVIFAGIALAVATVGTYGVMAYMVGQGAREIGIRIALGASRGRIVALVLGQGALLAGAGIGLGLGLAFVASRFLASLLFGIGARDPLTFASIAGLLLAVSLLAGYVPARRAARVDPVVSLRYE